MKVAFYKAFTKKSTLLDKVIGLFTYGKYSHCELVFSSGLSFSISPRDNQARFKVINFDDTQWDFIELKLCNEQGIAQKASKLIGKKYDYVGALFSAIPGAHIQKENKLFCSETVAYLIGLEDPHLYSPNDLYRKLKG